MWECFYDYSYYDHVLNKQKCLSETIMVNLKSLLLAQINAKVYIPPIWLKKVDFLRYFHSFIFNS